MCIVFLFCRLFVFKPLYKIVVANVMCTVCSCASDVWGVSIWRSGRAQAMAAQRTRPNVLAVSVYVCMCELRSAIHIYVTR